MQVILLKSRDGQVRIHTQDLTVNSFVTEKVHELRQESMGPQGIRQELFEDMDLVCLAHLSVFRV